MENIYQQAIADAKALRASAMANAKAALQEAFEPKIEEMVRLKLSEELDEVEEVEETELEEGDEMENEGMQGADSDYMEETEELGEADLEEILAELEALSEEPDETADPGHQEDPGQLDEAEELEEEEEGDEAEAEDVAGEEAEGETKEITVSLGDLKDLIDKIKSLDPELASDEMADDEAVEDDSEEESISLDEILAQLEEEDSLEEKKHADKEHSMEEKKDHKKEEMEEEKKHAYEAELEEAKATIAHLQESLNEINLLNAKLLYMNKIFKAKSLTESQKINVVKAFDKATSVKEVKNTFEILKESATTQKKSQINESFGYASKPAGVSPKANVIDADPFVSRWQKLAGI